MPNPFTPQERTPPGRRAGMSNVAAGEALHAVLEREHRNQIMALEDANVFAILAKIGVAPAVEKVPEGWSRFKLIE